MSVLEEFSSEHELTGHVQLTVNGVLYFQAQDAVVKFTAKLHDDEPPCETRMSVRYGKRAENGIRV